MEKELKSGIECFDKNKLKEALPAERNTLFSLEPL